MEKSLDVFNIILARQQAQVEVSIVVNRFCVLNILMFEPCLGKLDSKLVITVCQMRIEVEFLSLNLVSGENRL